MRTAATLTLCVLATLMVVSPGCSAALPPVVTPWAWPNRSMFTQIGYNTITKDITNSTFYYDAVNWVMHVANHGTSGMQGTYWIGNDLYMLQGHGVCIKLNMGFGIPMPNWFLTNSSEVHTLYQSHKYNASDMDFYRTLWTKKYSVGSVCSDCGPHFNYYSVAATGVPFKLEAPSPFGEVVNEFYSWKSVSSFPNGTFTLPSNLKCIDGGAAKSFLATEHVELATAKIGRTLLTTAHALYQMGLASL